MPALIVYGMPVVEESALEKLMDSMRGAVAELLKIPSDEVSVFFPIDRVKRGLGEELICLVECLFEKPERTPVLRGIIATEISEHLRRFAKINCRSVEVKIEVKISHFNQDIDGFASCTVPY